MKQFYVLTLALLLAGSGIIHGASAASGNFQAPSNQKESKLYFLGLGYKETELTDGALVINTQEKLEAYIARLNISSLKVDQIEDAKQLQKDLLKKPLFSLVLEFPTPAAIAAHRDILFNAFVNHSNRFAGKRVTPEQQAKIDAAEKAKKEVRAAAKAAGHFVGQGHRKGKK